MRIEDCSFCGRPSYPSKGITFIRNDAKQPEKPYPPPTILPLTLPAPLPGKSFRFCRSKCHRNFKMKRNPRKLKWTKAYRRNAGKEMVVDSTLLFSQRRNEPVRYDRDLVARTLEAMRRVSEVRQRRERAFYKRRMAGKRARTLAAAHDLVSKNAHLLPRMRGSEKKALAERAAAGEDVDVEAEEERATRTNKTKAFGVEKRRLRMREDGGVEAEAMDMD
ncbi:60S ribosomal protein L24 [Cordyceps fumosorosea ARSEF 2679]|uniref:60S ribosomal protein L24 n=1 Tax=Cordyceps fumosorosea (strain ARSEF 2679) TaxID=1081104 RepID=A0A167S618_CORFA|nr:60S ribosomal protein L24 [Cordyceps fumosorosea ARSEF 2679]OAA59295.1 60S ribosomal protein L24 [Cordyceps fumosorosea ARSEF 2679]